MNSPTPDPYAPLEFDAPTPTPHQQRVLDALRDHGGPCTVRRLSSLLPLPATFIRTAVRGLLASRRLAGSGSADAAVIGLPEHACQMRDPWTALNNPDRVRHTTRDAA